MLIVVQLHCAVQRNSHVTRLISSQ